MSTVYQWSNIGARLLYKIRHHKGHGIHSPFVFNLINNVIEEKLPYYSYKSISNYLIQFKKHKLIFKKNHLLSFRLINYFNAKNILEIGSSTGVNTLYLTAPFKNINCICIELDETKRQVAQLVYEGYYQNIDLRDKLITLTNEMHFDCIYINLDSCNNLSSTYLEALCSTCKQQSFIVVKGIRTNKKQNQLWRCLSANKDRTAELDLFDIGILFFDKQLSRWKYQISF